MSDLTATAGTSIGKRGKAAKLSQYGVWILAAAALIALPHVFTSGLAVTMMSLMGISIVFALSYNILLGQTGMLSFGHAVYYGLGAYFTVHAINAIGAAKFPIPLPLLPLVGGVAGLLFAALFGWVSTKRSGTAFAMISLGLAELVGSSSLILRSFFGGEEGVSTNRTGLAHFLGWNFGPQVQVYYLIAGWCLISAAAMYALTRTPFGRLSNAVRENPERVAFIGYNPQTIRFMAFCFAGFFGGIAGALAAINFELANSALFSAAQSALVLVATFIGGVGYFIGPVLGAVLLSYLQTMLSDITDVWQLYLGLLFVGTVMFAPGGLAHLIMMHRPFLRAGTLWRLSPSYLLGLAVLLIFLAGAVLVIEMTSHVAIKSAEGQNISLLNFTVDTGSWASWALAFALIAVGALGLNLAGRLISSAWDRARNAGTVEGAAL
jgi:branched-chain amino acid transport system permease protein